MSLPLLVFDLDGTLVDSRLDLAESANELLMSYGAAPLGVAAIVSMVGDGAARLVARTLGAAAIAPPLDEALSRFLAIYDRQLLNHTIAYPGIETALAALVGRATMAVLTNKPQHHTDRLLDALGLTRFFTGGVIGGDGPLPRKPDPAGLRALMTAAGADARRTLMVGDSMVDVETARAAGVQACVARYGFGQVPDLGSAPDILVARASTDLAGVINAYLGGLAS